MSPSETARTYDTLAEHWNSDEFNRDNGMQQHRRALLFVKKRGDALDVGCGSNGRFIDLLQDFGFRTEGLDISARMLELARERHPAVTFHHGDIVTWTVPKEYDFISAWDSIWHVPLSDQASVLKKLCAALRPQGVLIFSSGGLDEPDEVMGELEGQPLYHAAPGIPALLNIIAEENCLCRHLEFDQPAESDPGRHLYLIVQKRSVMQPIQ